eukprot:COSAG01_NODE_533_length_15816_cov_4.518738_6_plen_163_part_00
MVLPHQAAAAQRVGWRHHAAQLALPDDPTHTQQQQPWGQQAGALSAGRGGAPVSVEPASVERGAAVSAHRVTSATSCRRKLTNSPRSSWRLAPGPGWPTGKCDSAMLPSALLRATITRTSRTQASGANATQCRAGCTKTSQTTKTSPNQPKPAPEVAPSVAG